MKKLICMLCALSLCAAMFAACSKDESSSAAQDSSTSTSQAAENSSSAEQDSSSAETSSDSGDAASEEADTEKLASIVSALEEVNPINNPRAITSDDVEFNMNMTPDNLVAFQGDVTNTQSDCGLVFVAQVKDGTMDTVLEELEAYRQSMTSSLYVEFADKVAKAEDARIVSKDNIVVMVISSIDGPDYADIDAAIESALS